MEYLLHFALNIAGWMFAVGVMGYMAAHRYRLAVDLFYNEDDDVKAIDVTVVRR